MLPGVFQDGGEIPAHLMLGRKCGYGVETAAAFPSGQIGWIEWSERKHGLADRNLFGVRLTVASANFMKLTSGSDGIKCLSLDRYRYGVTQQDIDQLAVNKQHLTGTTRHRAGAR